MSLLFAATYPERTTALVLYGTYARFMADDDYPWGMTTGQYESFNSRMEERWGTGVGLRAWAPSVADDDRYREWWARLQRQSASPGAVVALMEMNTQMDARHVLSTIRVPALILHQTHDRMINIGNSRYLAENIPGAKFVELPGSDHFFWTDKADVILAEIQEFLTGVRPGAEPDRVLATVLFNDIVGSTEQAAGLGDSRWKQTLEGYYDAARKELERFRGREVKTTGDGLLATFDGPARAIRCAGAIGEAASALGLAIRTGLHTGECELLGDDISGIAVHIGARVASEATAGEVLVSSTVKDLVAGSGITFEDRGARQLKGVPDEWRLFAVT